MSNTMQLSMIHSTLTQTSFLISAGFRVGSSSLSAGIGLSHALCTAIDAVLGDTETSKAIATIAVLMQHEFNNPSTGVERVSMLDILSGSISFALLQRWTWEKTAKQLLDEDVVENVWDIVVVDSGDQLDETALSVHDAQSSPDPGAFRPSSASMISGLGEDDTGHSLTFDDNASISSLVSRRPNSGGHDTTRPEQAFKRQLIDQLQPGTSVKVTAHTVLRNTVAVEVQSDVAPEDIEPPTGYTLTAVQKVGAGDQERQRFVFSSTKKRARRGSFDVAPLTPFAPSTPLAVEAPSLASPDAGPGPVLDMQLSEPVPEDSASKAIGNPWYRKPVEFPARANEKRPRSPMASLDTATSNMQSLALSEPGHVPAAEGGVGKGHVKNTLKKSLSKREMPYTKLVDFWNHGYHGRSRKHAAEAPARAEVAKRPKSGGTDSSDAARNGFPRTNSRASLDMRPSIDLEQRPGSRESYTARSVHRRGGSSIYNLQTGGSDTSLVLHSDSRIPSRDRLAQSMNASGRLAGQYPAQSFAKNLARFAKFSVASYGSSFLRFMGAAVDQQPRLIDDDEEHHLEHRSFSQYAGLPPSTILVSSHVDPKGGANLTGDAEGAMPLIHFISVDHESKAVVLSCRGTLGFEDVLTDMTCDYDELHWRGKTYQVHRGMLASARRLIMMHSGRMISTFKAALEEFDDYGIILCGHSLGGGVAAILGVLMGQPNALEVMDGSAFVTSTPANQPPRPEGSPYPHPADALALTLPPNRPIQVYAFGPAATMSPSLAAATRGLITSVINNGDIVPYLCLGNLRDMQSIALSFKKDSTGAKAEVRRRVWDGLKEGLSQQAGLGNSFFARDWQSGAPQGSDEDEWPWQALQSIRSCITADKLVPPGESFIVERRAVLQRLAFTDNAGRDSVEFDGTKRSTKSFKPASHIRIFHVKDPAIRFSEIRFQTSMFLDHLPSRYELALAALETGVA